MLLVVSTDLFDSVLLQSTKKKFLVSLKWNEH